MKGLPEIGTEMIHDRFDLARWTAMFPLEQQRIRARRYMEAEDRQGRLWYYTTQPATTT